jgi:hypothetical protein
VEAEKRATHQRVLDHRTERLLLKIINAGTEYPYSRNNCTTKYPFTVATVTAATVTAVRITTITITTAAATITTVTAATVTTTSTIVTVTAIVTE